MTKPLRTTLREIARRARQASLRFALARAGSAALQFALVAPPFFLMMLGIVETGGLMFVSTHLEGAVSDAARQIRTGNVQGAADPIAAFRGILCAELVVAVQCDTRMVIDVRPFNKFSNVAFTPYYDQSGQPSGNVFNPGNAGDIVLVRVAYNWNIMTPLLGQYLGDGGSNRKLIEAAAAFRNEPYAGPAP